MLYDAARPLLSYVYELGFYRAAHEGPSVPYLPLMTETAHTRKRVDEFVARIIQGEFFEVMPEYDSPDAIARENSEPPRVGLEAMMANEKGALQRMKIDKIEALAVLVDGDRAAIHNNFEMTLNDGRKTQLEEIAWQQWRDGKIGSERYFWDPTQRKPR